MHPKKNRNNMKCRFPFVEVYGIRYVCGVEAGIILQELLHCKMVHFLQK